MLLAAATKAPLFLGIIGVVILVLGFVAVGALAVFVIKRAPKDGSDIGRDPRLKPDQHRRRNGSSGRDRRPRGPRAHRPRAGAAAPPARLPGSHRSDREGPARLPPPRHRSASPPFGLAHRIAR